MNRGIEQDMGASASRPGSREPSPSVSAASGFDPSRGLCAWLEAAAIMANDSWTRDRSVSIACTPNGFWIEGRFLIREQRREVRATQLRTYTQVAMADCNTLTDAVERVLHMLGCEAERARDSDGSPEGRDREAGLDGEAATARAGTASPKGASQ